MENEGEGNSPFLFGKRNIRRILRKQKGFCRFFYLFDEE